MQTQYKVWGDGKWLDALNQRPHFLPVEGFASVAATRQTWQFAPMEEGVGNSNGGDYASANRTVLTLRRREAGGFSPQENLYQFRHSRGHGRRQSLVKRSGWRYKPYVVHQPARLTLTGSCRGTGGWRWRSITNTATIGWQQAERTLYRLGDKPRAGNIVARLEGAIFKQGEGYFSIAVDS